MYKYAFLDRDGTLVFEPQDTFQVDSIEKLRILDGVIDGLQKLILDGYKLVMVTNQNGIGSVQFPLRNFEEPQEKLLKILRENGVLFEEIFVCPHFKEDDCACRKPKTGLVDNFFREKEIDLENSFMCGDRETDREFAENLGIKYLRMSCNGSFPRFSRISRNTTETEIFVAANLDGIGDYKISTGIGFFDHMLELFSKNSLIDLEITSIGDLNIDEHHTVEDTGIVLGQALSQALGNKRGIERYGFLLPMDESLAEVAIDLSGRPCLQWNVDFQRERIGEMPTELFEEFFKALSDNLQAAIHVNLRYGKNDHHKIEAVFKAFGRALKSAVRRDDRIKDLLPSTKGKL